MVGCCAVTGIGVTLTESAARPSANVAPMVTGLMEFSSHSVTESHGGGGAPGVSGASNRKDSTPDVAGDCCAAGFQSGLCRKWVNNGGYPCACISSTLHLSNPTLVVSVDTSRSCHEPTFSPNETLWNVCRGSALLHLDVGCPDHLAPFLGLLGNVFAEVGGRAWKHSATKVGKARP